jgi:hypothetical protein
METKKKVTSTTANTNSPNKKKVCQLNTTMLLSIFCRNAKTLILYLKKKTAKENRQGKENTSLQDESVLHTVILTNLTTFNCKPDYKTFGMFF